MAKQNPYARSNALVDLSERFLQTGKLTFNSDLEKSALLDMSERNRMSVNQTLVQFTREIANNLISNGDLDETQYGWINDPSLDDIDDFDLEEDSIFDEQDYNEFEGEN
ncbi:MAG: hypothetical protein ACRCX2_13900, partial [Paraclostridium sp.]